MKKIKFYTFIDKFVNMCKICRKESLEGLTSLDCSYCPLLTSIPNIEGLRELDCHNCLKLKSVSNIQGLETIFCYNCPLLTSIPSVQGLIYLDCSNCKWLDNPENPNFRNNLQKIKKIQRIYKKKREFQIRIILHKFTNGCLDLTNLIVGF